MKNSVKKSIKRTLMIIAAIEVILAEAYVVIDMAEKRGAEKIIVATDSLKDTSYGLRGNVYDLSTDLEKGYRVDRKEYTIDDEEYINWRNENMPVYGAHTDNTVAIDIIAADDGVKNEDIRLIVDSVAQINQGFIQTMADDSWKIIVTTQDMESGHKGATHANGLTNYSDKTITIKAYSELGKISTLYHEIGHVVASYAKAEIRENSEAIRSELNKLYCHTADGRMYVYLNSSEQLAECFNDFIWYPAEMQAQAPTLFSVYNSVVGQY